MNINRSVKNIVNKEVYVEDEDDDFDNDKAILLSNKYTQLRNDIDIISLKLKTMKADLNKVIKEIHSMMKAYDIEELNIDENVFKCEDVVKKKVPTKHQIKLAIEEVIKDPSQLRNIQKRIEHNVKAERINTIKVSKSKD